MNKFTFTTLILLLVSTFSFAQDFFQNGQFAKTILASPDLATTGGIIPSPSQYGFLAISPEDIRTFFWRSNPKNTNQAPDKILQAGKPLDGYQWRDSTYFANSTGISVIPSAALSIILPFPSPSGGLFINRMGSISFQNIKSICKDDSYMYVADGAKIYVWKGIPLSGPTVDPLFTLNFSDTNRPLSINSDGDVLSVCLQDGTVYFYKVNALTTATQPYKSLIPSPNLLGKAADALVFNNQVFVADALRHRILVWRSIDDLGNISKVVVLGAKDLNDVTPDKTQQKISNPYALSYDGTYLWVGEKEGRLVCFVNPTIGCIKPNDLAFFTPNTTTCPGAGINDAFSWNQTNNKVILTVEKYPFGTKNIVYSDSCLTTNIVTIKDFVSAERASVYRWRVRVNAGNCGDTTCLSDGSSWRYFYTRPTILSPTGYNTAYICSDSQPFELTAGIANVGDGGTVSYEWYKDGVLLPNSNVAVFKATEIGTYKMRMILKGAADCNEVSLEPFQGIKVLKFTPTEVTFTASEPKWCVGGNYFLAAKGAYDYKLTGSGIPNSIFVNTNGIDGYAFNISPKDSGNLMYRLEAIVGNCKQIKELSVRSDYSSVTFGVEGKDSICLGQTITFKGKNGKDFFWGVASIPFPSTDSIRVYKPVSAGAYNLQVFAVDKALGCRVSSNIFYTVIDTPQYSISFDKPFYCENDIAIIRGWGNYEYRWEGQYLKETIGANNSMAPKGLGVFPFKVFLKDAFGCKATYSQAVTVNPPPIITIVNAKDSICANTENYIVSATGADSYIWANDGNSETSNFNSYLLNFKQSGLRNILVKGTSKGCTSTATTKVFVKPNTVSTVDISSEGCINTGIYLKAIGQNLGANPTYRWEINFENFLTTTPTLIYPFPRQQLNRARVSVSGSPENCPLNGSAESNLIEIDCLSSPIYDIVANNVDVSPNPNDGNFAVSMTLLKEATVTLDVRNTLGQLVFTAPTKTSVGSYREAINLTGLPKGMYLVLTRVNTKLYSNKVQVN
jgi:Secretion system C-terminal sorting domain